MCSLFSMMFKPTQGWIKKVEADGQPARAEVHAKPKEVVALQNVAGYEGRDGWIDVPVRVLPPAGAPYEASMKCRISQALFGMLDAGMTVNVRCDPSDPGKLVLADDVNTLLAYRNKK